MTTADLKNRKVGRQSLSLDHGRSQNFQREEEGGGGQGGSTALKTNNYDSQGIWIRHRVKIT